MANIKKSTEVGIRCLICGGRLTNEMIVDKNPYNRKEDLAQCFRCGAVCAVQAVSNIDTE